MLKNLASKSKLFPQKNFRKFSIDPKPNPKGTYNKFLIISAGLLGVSAAIFAKNYFSSNEEEKPQKIIVSSQIKIGGPWKLINSEGKLLTDDEFKGNYVIYYFGFTRCPDICPRELRKLGTAINILNEKGVNNIKYLFISLDAGRDTPKDVAKFSKLFHRDITGLLTQTEDLDSFLKTFKLYSKKMYIGDDYVLDHSSYMYLFDKSGQFLTVLGANLSAEDLAHTIESEVNKNN